MNRPLFCLFFQLLCLATLSCIMTGCRQESGSRLADRVYALKLDRPPTESDWSGAPLRIVTVKGGRVHKINPLPDIDEDTVHVTTASCHHGSTPPLPLPVELRAFYTDRDLYLRLSWPDATRDEAMNQWRFDGSAWHASTAQEDGFGIVWDAQNRFPGFTCSYACHIDDFGVTGASFHALNRMKLSPQDEGATLDMWNWKAGRTGRFGFADDRTLSVKGWEGDVSGELFSPNSRAHSEGQEKTLLFAAGDQPIYDEEGRPVGKEFRPAGSKAPGYMTERPVGSRADISAVADFLDGRWTVTLRRSLQTADERDVRFTPANRNGVAFGLSVMDNTLMEHYASVTPERLVLLPPDASRP